MKRWGESRAKVPEIPSQPIGVYGGMLAIPVTQEA
jgi:hypothetical protein